MMKKDAMMKKTNKLVISGLCLALGLVLPFLTGQIKQIGSMLLPMHIPVLLCGYICGPFYGLAVGFICPLLRSLLFSMPKLMPSAVGMAFELASYGAFAGLFYRLLPKKPMNIYLSLIGAMLAGRAVWGIVSFVLYHILGNPFTISIFMAGALLNAIPGIIFQLIVIPIIVMALQKANLI